MENKLFPTSDNGYDCEAVESYILALKDEYKKVLEFAQRNQNDNEKLKKICRALSDENKTLKANAASSSPDAAKKLDAVIAQLEEIKELL